MTEYVAEACEQIDAAVFSGDFLEDPDRVAKLEEYMGRWKRAIEAHRAAGEDPESLIGWAAQ